MGMLFGMKRRIIGFATTMFVSAGLGLAGLGLASGSAQAEPLAPAPLYHWCPGEDWHPEWGFNFDWFTCHDDFHRDIDGNNHDHDFRPDQRGDQGPRQPWWPGQR
jgi:hypothetical protein